MQIVHWFWTWQNFSWNWKLHRKGVDFRELCYKWNSFDRFVWHFLPLILMLRWIVGWVYEARYSPAMKRWKIRQEIHSYKRWNQSNFKFPNWIERILNEFQFWKFGSILQLESNWSNFELIFIEFFEFILQIFKSNKFRTNSNLTPPLIDINYLKWHRSRSFITKNNVIFNARSWSASHGNFVQCLFTGLFSIHPYTNLF